MIESGHPNAVMDETGSKRKHTDLNHKKFTLYVRILQEHVRIMHPLLRLLCKHYKIKNDLLDLFYRGFSIL